MNKNIFIIITLFLLLAIIPITFGSAPDSSDYSLFLFGNSSNTTQSYADYAEKNPTINQYGVLLGADYYDYPGSDDRIEVSDNSNIDFNTSDFTMSAWINLDVVQTSCVICKQDGSWNANGWLFFVNGNGALMWTNGDGGAGKGAISTNGVISSSTWYHITAVIDYNNDIKIYTDGIEVSYAATKSIWVSNDNSIDLTSGTKSDLIWDMNGQIQGVSIIRGALNSTAVFDVYNKTRLYNPFDIPAPAPPIPNATVIFNAPINNSYINYTSMVPIEYVSNENTTCTVYRTRISDSWIVSLGTNIVYADVPISFPNLYVPDGTYEYNVSCVNNATSNTFLTVDTIPPTLTLSYEDINTILDFSENIFLYSNRTIWLTNFSDDSLYFDNTYLDIADNNYKIETDDINFDRLDYTTTNDGNGSITVTSSSFTDYVSIDFTLASELSLNYINVTVYDIVNNSASDSFYYYKPKINYQQPIKKHFLAGTIQFFNVTLEYDNSLIEWGISGDLQSSFRYIINGTYYDLDLVTNNSNSTFTNVTYKAEKVHLINQSPAVINLAISSQIDLINNNGVYYGTPNLDIYQDIYTVSDIDIGVCDSDAWLVYPWINFTFKDEQTEDLINVTVSFEATLEDELFSVVEEGGFTNNHVAFCTNIDPANFTRTFNIYGEGIVSKLGYVTRVFKLEEILNINGSNDDITTYPLFLPEIANSTTIQFLWQTKEFQLIDGTMFIYKCNGNNTKVLIDSTAISDGTASSNLQLLDTAYSYEVLYNNVLYNTGSYTDCHVETSAERTYYIDVTRQQISPVIGLFVIDCSVIKQDNSTVSMEWGSNEENTADEITGCLSAYYSDLSGRILLNETCNTDNLILQEFVDPGVEVLIVGTIIQDNVTGYCRDEVTLFFNNDNVNVFGKATLFFVVVLIVSLGLLYASEGVVLLFGAGFGVVVSYFLGLLVLPKTVISSIIFFLVIVGLIGRYFRKK